METIDLNEKLAEQAYEEIAAEKDGREPKDLLSTPPKDDDDKEANSETTKTVESTETPENTEATADEKPAEATEAEEKPAEAEDLDKKIEDYAVKNKLTYAEAKDDLEKTESILKQFKNDPAELAKALRNKDREYHKLRNEAEKVKQQKEPAFKRLSDEQFREMAKNKLLHKPQGEELNEDYEHPMVVKYRQMYPAKSRYLDAEAITEEIIDKSWQEYQQLATAEEQKLKNVASKAREELLSQITEEDRRFLPEVKAILLETDDSSIANGFDVKDALFWAKGKKYDADIKAAEERGFKRGKEGATIVGTKAIGQGATKVVVENTASGGLSTKQKERALEMYGRFYSDEESYKMYKETYEDDLKKDKNFIG